MTEAVAVNPYDEVPYESYPFPQSHPDRLATIAALFGLEAAGLERCRLLELGCSTGGNLLPLAEQLPGGRFVGIDASAQQIAEGRRALEAAELMNVELLHKNILTIDRELGRFDYIVVHGVFSWVPREVQEKILELCSQLLSDNGVAYISYNTYPGWRLRGTIRDLMTYRASFFTKPEEKLREARALLDFLSASVPATGSAYGTLLSDELEHLRNKQHWYLFHEYLEEVNEPEYFHQFMDRAHRHGLQYLGEADFSSMSAANFPPEVETMLRKLAGDVIQTEQYMDLVRNRLFRQTLLCRQEVKLDRSLPAERIYPLHVASPTEPEGGNIDIRSWEPVTFRRPGSTLTTKEPLVKAAMVHLRSIWPRPISFRDLLGAARSRLQEGPVIVDAQRDQRDAAALARPLLRCYATTHVDLHLQPSRANLEVTENPEATCLARHQAGEGLGVTNLWHEAVRLSDLERHLLRHLDGQNDLARLIDALAADVQSGRIVVQDGGRPLTSEASVREIISSAVPAALRSLARKGLLLATG